MIKKRLVQCVLVLGMSLACAAVTSSSSMVEADWAWQFAHREPAFQTMNAAEWSARTSGRPAKVDVLRVIDRGLGLADHLAAQGVAVDQYRQPLAKMRRQAEAGAFSDPKTLQAAYPAIRRITRDLALKNSDLDFDAVLFVKRKPSMFPHLSDQYYGWWSRPGGGIYVLKQFKQKNPDLTCLTEGWAEGNFLRPDLSYDAKRVVFAWARYNLHVADIRDKVDKTNQPEDSIYNI
jgi:hypothetical protein